MANSRSKQEYLAGSQLESRARDSGLGHLMTKTGRHGQILHIAIFSVLFCLLFTCCLLVNTLVYLFPG